MSLQDKLQIIVITYNREKHIQHMLETLLDTKAPTQNLNILVLDNNSTDHTAEIVKTFQASHPNLSYQKNSYNIGLGGNIARALELCNMEYLWLLGDDDLLHFDAWPDLEEAIAKNKELIVAARYAIPAEHEKDVAYFMLQLSFISACVFKTSLFTDTIMTNVVNNIYTLFPHLAPIVSYINQGKADNIYLLPRPLASNGVHPGTDVSYVRGYENKELYLKQRSMTWIVGYANILFQIQNKKLLHHMMEIPLYAGNIHSGWCDLFQFLQERYIIHGNWVPVFEVMRALPLLRCILMLIYFLSPIKFYYRDEKYWLNLFWFIKTKI